MRILFLLLLLLGLSFAQDDAYDYSRMLRITREMLTQDQVVDFLSETFKEELASFPLPHMDQVDVPKEARRTMTDTQFLMLLHKNPSLMDLCDEYLDLIRGKNIDRLKEQREYFKESFMKLIDKLELRKDLEKYASPLEPFVFKTKTQRAGYKNMKLFVNHKIKVKGQIRQTDNLIDILTNFIRGTKKEFMMNVFDFDIVEIADEIIALCKSGKTVHVGIDKGTIEHREAVKKVFNKMRRHCKNIVAVDAVGLNHQKMFVRDWSLGSDAEVIFSSGNVTYSGLSITGDLFGDNLQKYLEGLGENPQELLKPKNDEKLRQLLPKKARPNANHFVMIDGELPALVAHHNMSLSLVHKVRGSEFPLSGVFKIDGAFNKGASSRDRIYIAFTPRGGLKNVNMNVLGALLERNEGTYYLSQFAISSKDFAKQMLRSFQRDLDKAIVPKIVAVGDGPFSVREWSLYMWLNGFERKTIEVTNPEGEIVKVKIYVEDPKNEVRLLLGEHFEKFTEGITIANPIKFGEEHIKAADKSIKLTSKLHHKLVGRGDAFSLGSSFNISDGAESNTEQILIVIDEDMVPYAEGIITTLHDDSPMSIKDEVARREAWSIRVLGKREYKKQQKLFLKELETVHCNDNMKP
jgi:hypothetical protein